MSRETSGGEGGQDSRRSRVSGLDEVQEFRKVKIPRMSGVEGSQESREVKSRAKPRIEGGRESMEVRI